MERLLAAAAATQERRAQRRQPVYARPAVRATGPGHVWRWESTKRRGPTPGSWYNRDGLLDRFSRKIGGGLIAEREDAQLAAVLIGERWAREGSVPPPLTLHADRGAPMTAKTVAELLLDLGVPRAHSRPSGSNDTPYSERPFKTMN